MGLWILIGVIAYFVVGAVVVGIATDDETKDGDTMAMTAWWPFILVLMAVLTITCVTRALVRRARGKAKPDAKGDE